jgi:hypothetical protein
LALFLALFFGSGLPSTDFLFPAILTKDLCFQTRWSMTMNCPCKNSNLKCAFVNFDTPLQIVQQKKGHGSPQMLLVVGWLVSRLMESLYSYAGGDSHENGASTA